MFFHGFPFDVWGWGGSILGLLISILIICIVVRIIIRIVRGDHYYHCHRHHRHWDEYAGQDDTSSNARKILDERYAKGEITEEEYKRMKENLK